jgi:F420-0:gamma-glutamyl ligase
MEKKNNLSAATVRTRIFHPHEDIFAFLKDALRAEELEGKILAITSKVVSLSEGCLVAKSEMTKRALVEREADLYLGEGGYGVELTIRHGILIPSAGIDESNSESDNYILFPKNPYESAKRIWAYLRETFGLSNLGIILTDSHTMPLRRGVTGISLAHWGFKATRSLVGQPDIFGRPLKFTHIDVVDALASLAVFVMGEADDCTPLAVISNAKVEFTTESSAQEITIEPENDLYFPLLKPCLKKN